MLELEHRFRVVDVQARIDPSGDGDEARGRAITPEKLEREMRQAGVVRSVVYPTPPGEGSYLGANNAVARLSVGRPFVTFARIDGSRSAGDGATTRVRNLTASRDEHNTSPDDVEQYAYDDRFHGFKLDPAVDGLPDEAVLDALEDVDLPVLVHGGESFPPSALAETLLERPFPVVYEHFGAHPLRRELMDDAIGLLDRHENLYLDTSFVRYRAELERALREHPDRVLFGSGAPETHPNVGVMELLTLDVPEDTMRKAFSKNAARVVEALGPDWQTGTPS
jgi:predicted TIM-barrel fold metal-dependent hydrolase